EGEPALDVLAGLLLDEREVGGRVAVVGTRGPFRRGRHDRVGDGRRLGGASRSGCRGVRDRRGGGRERRTGVEEVVVVEEGVGVRGGRRGRPGGRGGRRRGGGGSRVGGGLPERRTGRRLT